MQHVTRHFWALKATTCFMRTGNSNYSSSVFPNLAKSEDYRGYYNCQAVLTPQGFLASH